MKRWMLAGALVGLAVGWVGCQYSDIAAFHNTTGASLTLRAEVDGEFARYDCDGSGSDLVRFVAETEVAIPPGQRLCLEGPATDFADAYDVRDLLVTVELLRGETVCLLAEGEALLEAFVPDGRFKTLIIDDEACPGLPDAQVAP